MLVQGGIEFEASSILVRIRHAVGGIVEARLDDSFLRLARAGLIEGVRDSSPDIESWAHEPVPNARGVSGAECLRVLAYHEGPVVEHLKAAPLLTPERRVALLSGEGVVLRANPVDLDDVPGGWEPATLIDDPIKRARVYLEMAWIGEVRSAIRHVSGQWNDFRSDDFRDAKIEAALGAIERWVESTNSPEAAVPPKVDGEAEATGNARGSALGIKEPTPAIKRAGKALEWIEEHHPDLAEGCETLGDVRRRQHDRITDHGCPAYENAEPPDFETWVRYTRAFLKWRDGGKNKPRAGRECRSAIRLDGSPAAD